MKYGKGARRSHPSKLARANLADLHPRIAAIATSAPTAYSLLASAPPRLDQGATGSCTAHGYAGSVATACTVADAPLGFVPSPLTEYAVTRSLERAADAMAGDTLPELTDSGAELADAIDAGATYGVCPMASTPTDVTPENVTNEPDFGALEMAATRIVTGAYRIDPAAASASDLMAAAIASGFPLYVGFFVDGAFENLGPTDVAQAPNENDPNGGGHAVFLAGYRTNAVGAREWLLCNSWGRGWADNGTVWCSEAWRAALWEVWVIEVIVKRAA